MVRFWLTASILFLSFSIYAVVFNGFCATSYLLLATVMMVVVEQQWKERGGTADFNRKWEFPSFRLFARKLISSLCIHPMFIDRWKREEIRCGMRFCTC